MAVDQAYILNVGPEFTAEPLARINAIINIAQRFINADFWPAEQLDFAVALLTCHILKMGNLRGAIGLGSKKAGDLSIGYTPSNIQNYLANTGYGLMLLQIMSTLVITPMVVGADAIPFNLLAPGEMFFVP